jgi:PKD repeat protein
VTFSASTRSGPTPLTVNFTNTSINTNSVTLWRWSFSGGNLPSSQVVYSPNASFTFSNSYTTNLSFNVALRGYTPGGNITSTSNNWITVTP